MRVCWRTASECCPHLVGVVVADDALVLGEAQLAALVRGQSEGGQEAGPQRVHRRALVSNCSDTNTARLHNQHDYTTSATTGQLQVLQSLVCPVKISIDAKRAAATAERYL